jgi:enoyl-CoA hydratase
MSGSEPLVLIERAGARAELVLNRPARRNALTGPLVEELRAGLASLVADDAVRVILIRGAGGTFCAGLDLDEMRADPPPNWRAGFPDLWADFHADLYACPKPTIGALERAAIAGGTALALACDVLIAGEGARFQVAEVKFGMAAPVNVVWLHQKFGAARTLELAMGGQPYTGVELADRGIALRAVPDADVLVETRAHADVLAANQPLAMATVKETMRRLSETPPSVFRERLALARRAGQSAGGGGPGTGLRGR